MLPPTVLSPALCLPVVAAANPVEVPYATDFDDSFAPTGNGYNWGHDWRLGKYQSWVSGETALGRTFTLHEWQRTSLGEREMVRLRALLWAP